MKAFAIILISLSSISIIKAGNMPKVEYVKSDLRNLFTFKVDKEWVGATVELVYSNGDVVTKEVLYKRKMIIDFCDVKTGAYSVVLRKGNLKKDIEIVMDESAGVQCKI